MRQPQRVVIHYLDGRLLRGYSKFFFRGQDSVRVLDLRRRTVRVPLGEIKAVFFVRRLRGRTDYHEAKRFTTASPRFGRKVEIRFRDGEVLRGRALDYRPEESGFYLKPSDPQSNNEMVFVPVSALRRVKVE
ncbi:MAG: hypothetical protein L0Z62_51330 [Gemmataceae bacterium]|nr:hypothetical protein [Gemmataceae bacterium]